ncbi:uncharacterized protein V2V93DRAFT_365405 [Kockiozyma suomiensis]|uniref:uncharacterized protein n=1 Tax=Kockiozyma suomiensis TaxID=1337062 RepID=UPI0033439DB3
MSYNNIGLSTARGSGTNGFIQANKANVRPRDPNRERQFRRYEDSEYGTKDDLEIRRDAKRRKSAKEIVDHDAAREIEVKCMELRIQLEDDEVDDEEIEKRVENLRKSLLDPKKRPSDSRQNSRDVRPRPDRDGGSNRYSRDTAREDPSRSRRSVVYD